MAEVADIEDRIQLEEARAKKGEALLASALARYHQLRADPRFQNPQAMKALDADYKKTESAIKDSIKRRIDVAKDLRRQATSLQRAGEDRAERREKEEKRAQERNDRSGLSAPSLKGRKVSEALGAGLTYDPSDQTYIATFPGEPSEKDKVGEARRSAQLASARTDLRRILDQIGTVRGIGSTGNLHITAEQVEAAKEDESGNIVIPGVSDPMTPGPVTISKETKAIFDKLNGEVKRLSTEIAETKYPGETIKIPRGEIDAVVPPGTWLPSIREDNARLMSSLMSEDKGLRSLSPETSELYQKYFSGLGPSVIPSRLAGPSRSPLAPVIPNPNRTPTVEELTPVQVVAPPSVAAPVVEAPLINLDTIMPQPVPADPSKPITMSPIGSPSTALQRAGEIGIGGPPILPPTNTADATILDIVRQSGGRIGKETAKQFLSELADLSRKRGKPIKIFSQFEGRSVFDPAQADPEAQELYRSLIGPSGDEVVAKVGDKIGDAARTVGAGLMAALPYTNPLSLSLKPIGDSQVPAEISKADAKAEVAARLAARNARDLENARRRLTGQPELPPEDAVAEVEVPFAASRTLL